MDFQIALILGQDGVTNGAIYALLALALVLAFAVTRVIFIPQGEFVAYGALTLVALQAGRLVGLLPEPRQQAAQQQLLHQAHARMRRHLEGAQFQQAQATGAAIR